MNRVEELVEVPNTEYVALIVGRNGHKIKAIRERTGTFIKTPLRNERPVFRIVGCPQKVNNAKQEILEVVTRLQSPQYRIGATLSEDSQQPRITSRVRVPFRFVGLVVGYQGQTVLEVQCKTNTHIQTPAHGGEPTFLITGEPKNVWAAQMMIQMYVEFRTGLRILETDALVDENLNATFVRMLQLEGISATFDALLASLNQRMPNDYLNQMQLVPTSELSNHDPFETIAMQLNAFNLEEKQYQELNDQYEQDLSAFYQPVTPPPSPGQSQVPTNFDAITSCAINQLFPPEMNRSVDQWLMQQQQQQQQLNYPAALEAFLARERGIAREKDVQLDATFWDYVANINNLPAEQVL